MRLPSPLYEGLPYLYLASGLIIMLMSTGTPLNLVLGLALYLIGSLVWIARSNARRGDRYQHRAELRRQRTNLHSNYLPEWFYEEQPFIYILAGLACQIHTDHILGTISATLLYGASLLVFYARIQHRKQPASAG